MLRLIAAIVAVVFGLFIVFTVDIGLTFSELLGIVLVALAVEVAPVELP